MQVVKMLVNTILESVMKKAHRPLLRHKQCWNKESTLYKSVEHSTFLGRKGLKSL